MKLGEFFKDQGYRTTKEGKLVKGKESEELLRADRSAEFKKMGYELDENGEVVLDENGKAVFNKAGKDFDPIHQKNHSYASQYAPFDRKHEKGYSSAELDEFSNDESLYEFAYKGEVEGEEESFEDIDIMEEIKEMSRMNTIKDEEDFKKALKSKPDYSIEEQLFMQEGFRQWLKKSFLNKSYETPEKEQDLINEFKSEFPENFAVLINKKVLSEEIEWEREYFTDKDGVKRRGLVSYYPEKNNAKIKYIFWGDKNKSPEKSLVTESVFVQSIKKNKNLILVFCTEVKKPEKKGPIIKKRFQGGESVKTYN